MRFSKRNLPSPTYIAPMSGKLGDTYAQVATFKKARLEDSSEEPHTECRVACIKGPR
jgi:hypothetical protein